MGNSHGKKKKKIPVFDPSSVGQRQSMAAWHRYGRDVHDVYETVETLGQGHMGEVFKVRRRQDVASSYRDSIRDNSSHHSGRYSSTHRSSLKADIAAVLEDVEPPASPGKKSILKASKYSAPPKTDFEVDIDENEQVILRGTQNDSVRSLTEVMQLKDARSKAAAGTDSSEDAAASSDHESKELDSPIKEIDKMLKHRESSGSIDSEDSMDDFVGELQQRRGSGGEQQTFPRRTIRFERFYACKTVLTARVKSGFLKQLMNEIYVMRTLDHPYILKLFEVYQVKRKIWLIMELCTGGDLTTRRLSEARVTVVLEQILRALAYMHKKGICHRDIKLENILYENGNENASIRLIDFGLSDTFDRASESRKAVVTAYTLSPEIASKTGQYTFKTDMWAVGVVAWILLAGDFPFVKYHKELDDKFKLNRLINAKYDFGITWKGRGNSPRSYDFVRQCLRKDPATRWSAKEALDFVQEKWIPYLEEADPDADDSKKLKATIANKRKNTAQGAIDMGDIQRFCKYGRLKKTILSLMAHTMDRKDFGQLSQMFLKFDTEDTGSLSLAEFKAALKEINPHIEEKMLEELFDGIDQDQSGQIHYDEFLASLAESYGLVTMERLGEAFDRIDTEAKGYISHDDLKMLLGRDYDPEVVNGMIEETGQNSGGRIYYDELLDLMFANPANAMNAVGDVAESLRSLDDFRDLVESARNFSISGSYSSATAKK